MLRSLLAVALIVASLAAAPRAEAWCRMTTSTRAAAPGECVHDGVPLAWTHRCSEYAFYSSGWETSTSMSIDQLRDIWAVSFQQWEQITCSSGTMPRLQTLQVEEFSKCDQAEYNQDAGNINTIAFVEDWMSRGYDMAAYAVTTVWHNTSTGEIYDADMEVNNGRGPYGVCDASAGCTDGTVDLQNVITHEAGHYFGMAHTPDSTVATMYAVSPPGEVLKRILKTDDVDGFCNAYGAGFGDDDCDEEPPGGESLECGGAVSCKCTAPGASAPGGASAGLGATLTATWLVVRRRRRRAR